MEKFMLIFQGGMQSDGSPEAMEHLGKWLTWVNKLTAAGKYASGEPLLPGGKIIKGNSKNVVDGPFVEIVGGFFIVNAADYDEAVALCEDYPDYDLGGTIQIRQVLKMEVPA